MRLGAELHLVLHDGDDRVGADGHRDEFELIGFAEIRLPADGLFVLEDVGDAEAVTAVAGNFKALGDPLGDLGGVDARELSVLVVDHQQAVVAPGGGDAAVVERGGTVVLEDLETALG